MQTITLDFETYFDKQYSLKKLATYEYIRDPRFKVHGVGIKIDDQPTEWWTNEIEGKLKAIDWANTCLIGHNLYFDATILFEHYGIVPARRLDTLSIAKALLPAGESCSLDNVATILGLGHKIAGTLKATEGVYDLDPDLLARLGTYCIQDVELTREIFLKLSPHIPPDELDLIDMTLRMATAPRLHVDLDMALQAEQEAIDERAATIKASGYSEKILSSNKQFSQLLADLGIEPPTKISKATGEETEAFGKSDPEFIELMGAHPEHQALWEGRLAAKSTIKMTRAKRWVYLASQGSKTMPMPLNYYGAHTGRWSGMDKLNVQNLPRGGALRKAIHAPKGHVVVVADSSQIEMRINAWFAGQDRTIERFKDPDYDPYREYGAIRFGCTEAELSKDLRQFSKAVVLGCGYGMGPSKFKHFCASGPLGIPPMYITSDEAAAAVYGWRNLNAGIVGMWRKLDDLISTMLIQDADIEFQCLRIQHERIQLPNGLWLDYSDLRATESGWLYGKNSSLWGGTLDENIIQALARIVIGEQMLQIDRLDDVQVVGCTHDEIISVCPEEIAEDVYNECVRIMSIPPVWAEGLPLSADGGWARNYSK